MAPPFPFAEAADECSDGYDASSAAAAERPLTTPVHEGITCDGCLELPITGIRHSCLVCPGLDFCGACVAAGRHPPQHPLLSRQIPLHPSWEGGLLNRLLVPRTPALLANLDVAPEGNVLAAAEYLGGLADAVLLPGVTARSPAFWEKELLRARAGARRWRGASAPELLDGRLFQPVKSERAAGSAQPVRAVAYRPLFDALCLVSVSDGMPILSLQLLVTSGLVTSLVRPPIAGAPANLFQGMVSLDNTQIAFAVTNLCDEGILNVDLDLVPLDSKWRIPSAHVRSRLNAANVVRAGESVSVYAHADTNVGFVLKAISDAISGGPVSVAQNAERMAAELPALGSHLRVCVTPQHGDVDMRARFSAGIRWEVLDMFVRKPTTQSEPPTAEPPAPAFVFASPVGNHGFSGGPPPPVMFGRPFSQASGGSFGFQFGGRGAPSLFGAQTGGGFGAQPSLGPTFGAQPSFGAAPPFGAPPVVFGGAAPGVNAAASPASAAPVHVNLPPVTFPTAAIAPPGLVLGSAVASVVAGPQAAPVLVRAANPHLVWDRSLTTEALLGLAVQPALTAAAKHCTEGLVARAEELLRAYSSNTLVRAALGELAASFQSAECVACLESEPPPDALLLPCGHICMHWEEAARVETCPLCRKLISARICVSDGKYVAAPGRQVVSLAAFFCPPFLTPIPFQPRQAIFRNQTHFPRGVPAFFKPVIYLYPAEQSLDVDVTVALAPSQARFTALIPRPSRGSLATRTVEWRVRAAADGTLTALNEAAHPPVASLFWESVATADAHALAGLLPSDGAGCFCVPGAELGDWLLRALPRLGLTVREYTEMATFWAVKLGEHAHIVLRFLSRAEMEEFVSSLIVQPRAQTVIRVYLVARGVTTPPRACADTLLPDASLTPGRTGFTAVEWGGMEL